MLRFFLQGSARRLGSNPRAPEACGMDSLQKRDRDRRKLQKRRDKQARRKERADSKHQQAPETSPAPDAPPGASPGVFDDLRPAEIAAELGPTKDQQEPSA